jgi:hypothetical protein
LIDIEGVFLFRGKDPDQVKCGYSLVNWQTCLMPKNLGGLGIKDIDKFSRALRMKWLWHKWDPRDRQWKKILKVHDASNRALFFCSTYMHVGNGLNTPFWEAKWLHGAAPKDFALGLFKMARFKNRSVATELRNNNWIRSLVAINTSDFLEKYIMLHTAMASIHLSDQLDEVIWRWSANGKFSVALTYNCQFKGCIYFLPSS